MTAAELFEKHNDALPDALVAYLSQADVDVSVCRLHGSNGPHLGELTTEAAEAFVAGLVRGKISRRTWRACAELLLAPKQQHRCASYEECFEQASQAVSQPRLLDAVVREYYELITSEDFETHAQLQKRLYELHRMYVQRPPDIYPTPELTSPLFVKLRAALAEGNLGPNASRFGRELILADDLEHDRWRGNPVTTRTIDGLAARHEEKTLRRFLARLRSAELRQAARRSIIRLRIAESPYAEVKNFASDVEAKLMRGERHVVETKSMVLGGTVANVLWRNVLVRQRVSEQRIDLLGTNAKTAQLGDALKLRDVLQVRVKQVSLPISVCAPVEDLDPSPCFLPSDIAVDSPYASINPLGEAALKLSSGLKPQEASSLAQNGNLDIPVRISGTLVGKFELGLRFERPKDLFWAATAEGADGPDLDVAIDCPGPQVLSYHITEGSRTRLVFVDAQDVDVFRVESRGARGAQGAPGMMGMMGTMGSQCQPGGNGSPGGAGSMGEPGGDGGDITVRILCKAGLNAGVGFTVLQKILTRTILSVGGPGGPGGLGGLGGIGGPGGPPRAKTTHRDSEGREVTDDGGCSGGSMGNMGFPGPSGPPGPTGSRGVIRFVDQ